MIRLPRRDLAAIEAVLDIAYHGAAEPVRGAEIADRLGVPRRYLEHSLQALARGGVLIAQRGPRGGYRLARERRRISVADIVRALNTDDDGDASAPADAAEPGSDLGRRVIGPMAAAAEAVLQAHLDTVTLDALCAEGRRQGIAGARDRALDFSI
jgi:Rrf2 family protein